MPVVREFGQGHNAGAIPSLEPAVAEHGEIAVGVARVVQLVVPLAVLLGLKFVNAVSAWGRMARAIGWPGAASAFNRRAVGALTKSAVWKTLKIAFGLTRFVPR